MKEQSDSPKKPWYKKPLWVILAGFVTIVLCANAWLWYKDTHPQTYVNFTQYVPTKIVDGLQIRSKALLAWNSTLFSEITVFTPYHVNINLILDREHSYIGERRDKDSGRLACDVTFTVNAKCAVITSPSGQSYALTLIYQPSNAQLKPVVYDELTTQEAIFYKNGTRINITIATMGTPPISEKDWNDMIDSFQPTIFNDLKVAHMHPGP